MRRRLALIVVVLAFGTGALALPSSTSARSCGSVSSEDGDYHVIITSARRASCSRAKRIVRNWIEDDARPSAGPDGWRCKSRYGRLLWRCERGRATIRFTRHKYG